MFWWISNDSWFQACDRQFLTLYLSYRLQWMVWINELYLIVNDFSPAKHGMLVIKVASRPVCDETATTLKQTRFTIHDMHTTIFSVNADELEVSGEETAEHLLLSCPRWAVELRPHFGDSIDIKNVFRDYVNPAKFLISSGHTSEHLPPHIGIFWCIHHDNDNNNNGRFLNKPRETARAVILHILQTSQGVFKHLIWGWVSSSGWESGLSRFWVTGINTLQKPHCRIKATFITPCELLGGLSEETVQEVVCPMGRKILPETNSIKRLFILLHGSHKFQIARKWMEGKFMHKQKPSYRSSGKQSKHCVNKEDCLQLGLVSIWSRVGHAQYTSTTVSQVWLKFILERITPDWCASETCAIRITALYLNTLITFSTLPFINS